MKKLSLFIFVLLFSGCSSVQDKNIDAEKSETMDLMSIANSADYVSYPMGLPASSDVDMKNYRWGTQEGEEKVKARNNAIRRSGKAIAAVEVIYPVIKNGMDENSNQSADKIIASIQAHLDNYQDREETFLIEQITATRILHVICLNYTLKSNLDTCWNEKWDSKKIQLLNFATSLFVKNANPNADLIAYNLEKLEGSVPDETLEHYAKKTIKSSKAWFSDDNLCVECSSANTPGNLDRKTQLVQKGVSDLNKYIE
jgi:uncharacterized protein YceK